MTKAQETFRLYGSSNAYTELLNYSPLPGTRYIIAMTPRSGSSYLADVMTSTRLLGTPEEYLNLDFLPEILKAVPSLSPDEYLPNILKHAATPNGVSGIKASWGQFRDFKDALNTRTDLLDFRYIYLIRRSLPLQAISLYRATETGVFHTNVTHGEQSLSKLAGLQYDGNRIAHWHQHIVYEERGWLEYFVENRLTPLTITYEDIEEDIGLVVQRIANFLQIDVPLPDLDGKLSIFKKIGQRLNIEWATRFMLEQHDREASKQA